MERSQPQPPTLSAATVRKVVRISVEGELLDPSLRRWSGAFLRRARGAMGTVRGRSRDRLDATGEAFFEEALRPRLLHAGVERVRRARRDGKLVVLMSGGVDHVVRPIARHLAADRFVASGFEFRDGIATGRRRPQPSESGTWPARRKECTAVLVDDASPAPLSVSRALSGRRILLVGATGFIGKVWLAGLLESVPDLATVHVLLRRRGARSPDERLARMIRESPVFDGPRRRFGSALEARLRVHDGDIRRPDLGLSAEARHALEDRIDVVVNCAGLVEFNPDPRDALAVNVDGALHLLEFAKASSGAALLHVSTCFVAGRREGRIPERIDPERSPSGERIDPAAECERLRRDIRERTAAARERGRPVRSVRHSLIEGAVERARELGWPNIYTYTKALGEALIARRMLRGEGPRVTVVRPSIVESAVDFPLRGWNEGVNTSAPLSHLLGTYFRQLPVNQRKRLDVIPVDLVCRGLTLVVAALLENRHAPVVQLATSAVNPLDLRRVVELTALAHQKHHRSRPGWRSRILARLDAVPVSRERYGRLSVPAQLRVVRAVNRALRRLGRGWAPLARVERTLQRVKELVDLYEPFLLDNEPVFEATRIETFAAAVPREERERFGYDARPLDWYDYWIDVHIPGLRRWSYPLIEGRPIEAGPAPEAGRSVGTRERTATALAAPTTREP